MTELAQASAENHYVWGDHCDGWHLLRSDSLSVIEERMPPGALEQRHFHSHARQFFYVLEGELTMELDGQLVVLGTRQSLEIPPGQAHQAMNKSVADVRFLVISQPPSHGDRTPA
jgi:mannose-6-phosphate isomerase-like protein (cupin superfamily)